MKSEVLKIMVHGTTFDALLPDNHRSAFVFSDTRFLRIFIVFENLKPDSEPDYEFKSCLNLRLLVVFHVRSCQKQQGTC